MNRIRAGLLTFVLGLLLGPALLLASDPPHAAGAGNIQCVSCHKLHGALGGTLTSVKGNSNLCLSCHVSGGLATNKALLASDQAIPAGLVGATASGTSHRWDSGPQGRLTKGTPNTSTGTIKPSGAYTGAYTATVELKISTPGAVGTAKYDWRMTTAGSTTVWTASTLAVPTTTIATALGTTGVSLAFSATGTFVFNDIFYLYVRSDLRAPVAPAMLNRTESGNMMCSSCHDQHLQANLPFDPTANQSYTAGATNSNRHFQRVANNANALCADCHAARAVGVGGGSHPVGVVVAGTNLKAPTAPLVVRTDNTVQCLTCHDIHKSPTADGSLLRVSYQTSGGNPLCVNCHTLAYTPGPAAGGHFNTTTGALWPGDKFGTNKSTYPAITDTTQRGTCKTCHAPHGWRNADTAPATLNYRKLLGARQDNLCESCHDGTVTGAPNVRAEFIKLNEHPIDRTSGRMVACGDCHNPHMAINGSHVYATTADVNRNRIRNAAGTTFYSGALKGVDGVQFNYSGLALWTAPVAANFTKLASGSPTVPISGAEFEYQVCFKCHTSYDASGATRPGGITNYYSTGTAKFINSNTVTGTGTAWTAAMVGMYIQKTPLTPSYRITAATATSLTITPVYAQVFDGAAAAYTITKQQTDLAIEFNPANRSGHPVTTGLNNYTGSSAPKALVAAQMKAPWATNLGTQTMMCSDCHNTDAATPAAQGPHGSAAPFMLRGANAANWPNVTLQNFATSWCANCHTTFYNDPHGGHHTSYPCYDCHVVIPHGSKRSRLMGDRTNMPARYAYQNDLTKMQIQGFRKAGSLSNYSDTNCQAACDSQHSGVPSPNEAW